jgi:leucyl aminopeptidase
MSEMKFDMSGRRRRAGGDRAIARLGLPVRSSTVIGATENCRAATRQAGDIVRAKTGTTIEIINTDAEGRLVLADCLAHAIDQGAERLIDLATLTGAIVTRSATRTRACSADDEWSRSVEAAPARRRARVAASRCTPSTPSDQGRVRGHRERVEDRKAGSIVAAEFLKRFTAASPGRTSTSPARRGNRQAVHAEGRARDSACG